MGWTLVFWKYVNGTTNIHALFSMINFFFLHWLGRCWTSSLSTLDWYICGSLCFVASERYCHCVHLWWWIRCALVSQSESTFWNRLEQPKNDCASCSGGWFRISICWIYCYDGWKRYFWIFVVQKLLFTFYIQQEWFLIVLYLLLIILENKAFCKDHWEPVQQTWTNPIQLFSICAGLLREPWFYPTMTAREAGAALAGRDPGTFLVRFSEIPVLFCRVKNVEVALA